MTDRTKKKSSDKQEKSTEKMTLSKANLESAVATFVYPFVGEVEVLKFYMNRDGTLDILYRRI
jgi:hypothetical protein